MMATDASFIAPTSSSKLILLLPTPNNAELPKANLSRDGKSATDQGKKKFTKSLNQNVIIIIIEKSGF